MKIAKIIAVAALACTTAFALTSCTKEGAYNPKKKISKIYVTKYGNSEQLSETWTWDKKTLTSINMEGSTINLSYDKNNRLSSATSGTSSMTYEYDGKFLSKITCTEDGELAGTYTFTHDGKTISHIKMEIVDGLFSNSPVYAATMRMIPAEITQTMQECAAQNAIKGIVITYDYDLTWEKNNVTQIVMKSNADSHTYTFTYTYSEYLSPFRCSFFGSDVIDNLCANCPFGLSKNLPVSCHVDWGESTHRDIEYTYTYTDKYPLTETRNVITTMPNNSELSNPITYRYEY